jgi:hypothetical protein
MYDVSYVSDLTKGKNKELNWIELNHTVSQLILHIMLFSSIIQFNIILPYIVRLCSGLFIWVVLFTIFSSFSFPTCTRFPAHASFSIWYRY